MSVIPITDTHSSSSGFTDIIVSSYDHSPCWWHADKIVTYGKASHIFSTCWNFKACLNCKMLLCIFIHLTLLWHLFSSSHFLIHNLKKIYIILIPKMSILSVFWFIILYYSMPEMWLYIFYALTQLCLLTLMATTLMAALQESPYKAITLTFVYCKSVLS